MDRMHQMQITYHEHISPSTRGWRFSLYRARWTLNGVHGGYLAELEHDLSDGVSAAQVDHARQVAWGYLQVEAIRLAREERRRRTKRYGQGAAE